MAIGVLILSKPSMLIVLRFKNNFFKIFLGSVDPGQDNATALLVINGNYDEAFESIVIIIMPLIQVLIY